MRSLRVSAAFEVRWGFIFVNLAILFGHILFSVMSAGWAVLFGAYGAILLLFLIGTLVANRTTSFVILISLLPPTIFMILWEVFPAGSGRESVSRANTLALLVGLALLPALYSVTLAIVRLCEQRLFGVFRD